MEGLGSEAKRGARARRAAGRTGPDSAQSRSAPPAPALHAFMRISEFFATLRRLMVWTVLPPQGGGLLGAAPEGLPSSRVWTARSSSLMVIRVNLLRLFFRVLCFSPPRVVLALCMEQRVCTCTQPERKQSCGKQHASQVLS